MIHSTTDLHINTVVIPPDGGYGWFVVFVAFCWTLVTDGTIYTFGFLMQDMQKDFKVTTSLLSVASSLQNGLCFMLGPLVAAMINRFGFRFVSSLGGLLSFAGVLGSAYAPDIYFFLGTFGVVLGLAFSMTYMSNILIVGFYFTRLRAVATSIATTGTAVGVSISPIIFSMVLYDLDWRLKYKYISGGHLLLAIVGCFVYKPVKASEIIIDTPRPGPGTGGGGKMSETSSVRTEYEKGDKAFKKNTDYLTNTEALYDLDYTIIPTVPTYELKKTDSKASDSTNRTNRTQHSTRLVSSMNYIYPSFNEDVVFRNCCICACNSRYRLCKCLWHLHRPLYRDDILFHGNTKRLPQYNKALDKTKAIENYNMSVTRISKLQDLPQNADCCMCCPESVTRVLGTMLDISLLKSGSFMLLCFSGFLTYLGIYVPYIYGIEITISCNIERTKATYFLTAVGVSNAVGRFLSGPLTLIPRLNALLISEVTLLFAGAAVIVHPFLTRYEAHLTVACVFGFNIATVSSLRTIVVVDILGLEKLTNAYGLIVMLEGISCLMALPLNSYLYEWKNSFLYPCAFSGVAIFVSGLILIPVGCLSKRDQRRKRILLEQSKINKTLLESQFASTSARGQSNKK